MKEKVQTGLRIPIKKYRELVELSAEIGISVNSLILTLIDLGLSLRNGDITSHREEKPFHAEPHSHQETVE